MMESAKIFKLNSMRKALVKEVFERSYSELTYERDLNGLEFLLRDTLYLERIRLKREKPNLFTKKRYQTDKKLWNWVKSELLKNQAQSDRREILKKILYHYADEIAGHFSARVYRFATRVVPWGLSWMLNALSVQRLIPGKFKEFLNQRIQITGEVEHLRKLAQKGTILLVPTHQSNLDSPLLGYVIFLMGLPPFCYGAGLNLFTNPVLSFFMKNLGAYTVDRKKNNLIYKNVLKNYSTSLLKQGVHSVFFPGGGRCRSGAIEKKLKLGLLGTALQAQIELIQENKAQKIFIVPMVTSYHFVLEAASLVEDFLMEKGKSRYIIMDDESWQPFKVLNFFKKFFLSDTTISIRIGKPFDVLGNEVDENGNSFGPHQTSIEVKNWVTSRGETKVNPQRDHEYTKILGNKLVDRFHQTQIVLSSTVVATAYFNCLRQKYPQLDIYHFLRMALSQRVISYLKFKEACLDLLKEIQKLSFKSELFLSSELQSEDPDRWILNGMSQLGLLHDANVLKKEGDDVYSEDLNLIYYYRNRLTGYQPVDGKREIYDSNGFLV